MIAATVSNLFSSAHGTFTSPVVGRFGASRLSSELNDNPSLLDHNSSSLAALYSEQSKPYQPLSAMNMWPLISAAIKASGFAANTRFMKECPVFAIIGRPPAEMIAFSTFIEHLTS